MAKINIEIMMPYATYYCKICEKEKESMDMHNEEQCKLCWSKIEDKTNLDRVKKMLVTRFNKFKV